MLDLLIINGTLFDAFSGISGKYAVGIEAERIAGIYPTGTQLPESKAVLDAKGLYVSPGWVDLHTHVYPKETSLGIDPDLVGLRQGVTTVVDAGSAGEKTFAAFAEKVIGAARTEVLAWLNIAGNGLCGGLAELADLTDIDVRRTSALVKNTPCIRGIKVRMSSSVLGASGLVPLYKAKEAAALADCPVMVHIGNGPPDLSEILDLMGSGDIVTHAFHGKAGGCFDQAGRPIPALTQAIRRGVYLDVGHGTSSFAFARLEKALAAGIWPDTISTDIYCGNDQGLVVSLARTVEKCLALGLPLMAAVAAVTAKPAAALGLLPNLGTLRGGTVADITLFSLRDEMRDFVDAEGEQRTGLTKIKLYGAVKAGKVWLNDD